MKRVPLRRTAFHPRRTWKRTQSTKRMHNLRAALNERCNGECERCGFPLDIQDDGSYLFEVHHRQQRSAGGKDTIVNCVAVSSACHTLHRKSIHEDIRQATEDGFLVESWSDPERVAILYKGIFSWLKRDGSVVPVTPMYPLGFASDDMDRPWADLDGELQGEAAAEYYRGEW